jgi:hypothetical protein
MAHLPEPRLVPAYEIRQRFNDGHYWQQAQTGKLQQLMYKDQHPSAPKAPVPICTRSQLIKYLNAAGVEIAMVHQYLQPDGTLGATGRPDPKRLFEDGVLYVPEP